MAGWIEKNGQPILSRIIELEEMLGVEVKG